MNKIIEIGRITKDIELTTTNNGLSVAKFSLAVNRRFKSENEETNADFFKCIAFKGTGENIAKFCHKGSKVCIVGELQTRNYEDKDGIKRYVTEIIVNECEFLDSKKDSNENTTNETEPKETQPVEEGKLPF